MHGDFATATVFNENPADQAPHLGRVGLRMAARGRPERLGRRARCERRGGGRRS
ncbi:MAG: hypothetical protein WDM85_13515 [Caulobacteraceae bacterium]